MSIITREIMKFHRHKFWFLEKCVTFLMSSTSVFPSKMTVITDILSFSVKSFWHIQHFFALSKSVLSSSVIIIGLTSEDQTFSISFPSLLQNISATFSFSRLFCIQNRFQFFPVTDKIKAESREFVLLILFCI